jgi:hypothetical protein
VTKPARLQLSRKRGFNLQAHSRAVNGLPAVNCARPGPFGNPFVIGEIPSLAWSRFTSSRVESAEDAVELFRRACMYHFARSDDSVDMLLRLRGKNLACFCKPGDACHADVLLELANRPEAAS